MAAKLVSMEEAYAHAGRPPMTGNTESLIEGAIREGAVPGPAGSDVLSDMLSVFRVTGAALLRAEMAAPVATDIPPAAMLAHVLHPGATRIVVLHIVAKGSLWVEARGVPRRRLPEGSVIGFPHGDAHRLGVGESARPMPATDLMPPLPWVDLPVLRNTTDNVETHLVCVYLRCDELLFNPILDSLPPLLCITPDEGGDEDAGWIGANTGHIVREATVARPGNACLIARLTELLFIEILRRHIASSGADQTGWLAALADPHLARALACFHHQPARAWTLDEVAVEAALSRTALIERFQSVLEAPPMRYLTLWRLQLAARALRGSDRTLAQIAEEVGYGSEAALSRAFKRETSATPTEWRRGQRAPSRSVI